MATEEQRKCGCFWTALAVGLLVVAGFCGIAYAAQDWRIVEVECDYVATGTWALDKVLDPCYDGCCPGNTTGAPGVPPRFYVVYRWYNHTRPSGKEYKDAVEVEVAACSDADAIVVAARQTPVKNNQRCYLDRPANEFYVSQDYPEDAEEPKLKALFFAYGCALFAGVILVCEGIAFGWAWCKSRKSCPVRPAPYAGIV